MKLEKFNHYGKFVDFDPDLGTCLESNIADAQTKFVGIGHSLNNACIAMIVKDGGLFLYIGKVKFDLQDPTLKLLYEHKENGTTVFSATDSINAVQIIYDSWWRIADPGVAAFGTSDDEDEDICAYITLMTGAESRRQHVIARYS